MLIRVVGLFFPFTLQNYYPFVGGPSIYLCLKFEKRDREREDLLFSPQKKRGFFTLLGVIYIMMGSSQN
jgi:hypothetical protein